MFKFMVIKEGKYLLQMSSIEEIEDKIKSINKSINKSKTEAEIKYQIGDKVYIEFLIEGTIANIYDN